VRHIGRLDPLFKNILSIHEIATLHQAKVNMPMAERGEFEKFLVVPMSRLIGRGRQISLKENRSRYDRSKLPYASGK
jgi:hypothetical protein